MRSTCPYTFHPSSSLCLLQCASSCQCWEQIPLIYHPLLPTLDSRCDSLVLSHVTAASLRPRVPLSLSNPLPLPLVVLNREHQKSTRVICVAQLVKLFGCLGLAVVRRRQMAQRNQKSRNIVQCLCVKHGTLVPHPHSVNHLDHERSFQTIRKMIQHLPNLKKNLTSCPCLIIGVQPLSLLLAIIFAL